VNGASGGWDVVRELDVVGLEEVTVVLAVVDTAGGGFVSGVGLHTMTQKRRQNPVRVERIVGVVSHDSMRVFVAR
jgi:hypothetical protein